MDGIFGPGAVIAGGEILQQALGFGILDIPGDVIKGIGNAAGRGDVIRMWVLRDVSGSRSYLQLEIKVTVIVLADVLRSWREKKDVAVGGGI